MIGGRPVLASRRVLRVLLVLAYAHIAVAGLLVVLEPPERYADTASVLIGVWGLAFTIAGTAATVGVIARRRVLEWCACYVIAAGFLLYTWIAWDAVPAGIGNFTPALVLAAGVLASLARGTYLALEDYTARRIAIVTRGGRGE